MVILEHEITLIGGPNGRRRCRALFDSGASCSIIRPDIANAIATPILLPDPEDRVFETALAGHTMQATQVVALNFRFEDSEAEQVNYRKTAEKLRLV